MIQASDLRKTFGDVIALDGVSVAVPQGSVIFPLMFASSAFVPVSGLPGWLQVVAAVNPLTYAIDAARGWALADPTVGATVGALLAAALLTVAAGAVAARGVRRP